MVTLDFIQVVTDFSGFLFKVAFFSVKESLALTLVHTHFQ